VRDLKAEIEARMQIPRGEQVLLKNGRELKGNDDCLAAHRITFTNANLEVLLVETREVPQEEQSLSISFRSASGIPDGSILSIRAGTKGRQMPLRFDEPFKLPTTKEASALFKIDVFSQFGKARLTLRPGKYVYEAQIEDGEGAIVGSLEFEARDTSERDRNHRQTPLPQPAKGSSRRAQATVLASSYLDEHGLIQYLQGLLQSVLREKPADPYAYMIRQLQAAQLNPETEPANSTTATSEQTAATSASTTASTSEQPQPATATVKPETPATAASGKGADAPAEEAPPEAAKVTEKETLTTTEATAKPTEMVEAAAEPEAEVPPNAQAASDADHSLAVDT